MALALTEEQEILQRTAREFVQGKSSFKRIRTLRDEADGEGFSRELWAEMGRLGWLGIVVPEAYGGAGLGWVDLMVVLEELGRGLIPEPIVGTLLLGTTALLLGGSEAQKAAHLPSLVAGERYLALAYQEPASRYAHHHVGARAERSGSGWTLRGEKTHGEGRGEGEEQDGRVQDGQDVCALARLGVQHAVTPGTFRRRSA